MGAEAETRQADGVADTCEGRKPGRLAPGVEALMAYQSSCTLLCGFAFAGLVMYLGSVSKPQPLQLVAAGLLTGGFFSLFHASFMFPSLIGGVDLRKPLSVLNYRADEIGSAGALGVVLLLASVCVMAFAWSCWLGGVTTGSLLLLVARWAWVARHEAKLSQGASG
jgi:hypothetical protein